MNGRHEHEQEHGRTKIDHDQFKMLMLELRGIRHAIQSVALAIVHTAHAGDEKAIAGLTAKLHQSAEDLRDSINANKQ